KLRTSIDIIQLSSDENYHRNLPSTKSKNYRFHPITNYEPTDTHSSSSSYNNNNNIENDNVDWELVTKQLETILFNYHTNLPSTKSKNYRFHPITNYEPTGMI
ncbi:unnamed protein product, partial [Rotaria sordida]